jgi:hypothetical protein
MMALRADFLRGGLVRGRGGTESVLPPSASAAVSCWTIVGLSLIAATGCGPISYTIDADKAEHVVSAARAENAAYYAPYELHFAEAHLEEAHEQASHGRYEDAIHAAEVALASGERALDRSAQPGHVDR